MGFWNREILLDHIKYLIKDLDTNISNMSVDDLADGLAKNTDDYSAMVLASLSDDLAADILNSPKMPASKAKSILSSPRISADRVQSILYKMIDLKYFDKLINIMTFDAIDETISANTSNTEGIIRRKTLTINAGVTLSIDAPPGVIIADTIDNEGVIVSGWIKGAGGSTPEPTGKGGDGAGGLIIIARTMTIGEIHADGRDGESGSTTSTEGDGGDGGAGMFWEIEGYPPGSGGKGGTHNNYGSGSINAGGGGGTYNIGGAVPRSGSGGAATRTIYNTAEDLIKEIFKCIIDWYIQNILGKTPSTVKSIPELGGSGGGGGLDWDGYGCAGGGGGGGGEIIIYGTTINAGYVTAKGGKGGNGGSEGSIDEAGGGGGGGVIYVFYKVLNGTMTYDVSGGAGGSGDHGTGDNGSAGSYAEFAV